MGHNSISSLPTEVGTLTALTSFEGREDDRQSQNEYDNSKSVEWNLLTVLPKEMVYLERIEASKMKMGRNYLGCRGEEYQEWTCGTQRCL